METLAGFLWALGAPWRARLSLAIMAGGGASCPEGEPLKARRLVVQASCYPPAAGLKPARL